MDMDNDSPPRTANRAVDSYVPTVRAGHQPVIECTHKIGDKDGCPVPHEVWLKSGLPAGGSYPRLQMFGD
jgi:hypothetical protein